MSRPTRLELFAAFTAQFPLLTREDLEATVDDMRRSSGFHRMLAHARDQAEAIGLEIDELGETKEGTPVLAEEEKSGPFFPSGFHLLGRVAN